MPQRPREDPLLLDDGRRALDAALIGQDERSSAERLLLKIAIGAATERFYLSYPRLDVSETRARVPSFYALDVVRAITGRVPDHRVLAAEAAEEGGASLAWPAPQDPDRAIDDLEHDLAVAEAAARRARSVDGEGARALPARAQRVAAPLGDQPLGARPRRLVAERRADQGRARHRRRRSPPNGCGSAPYSLSALQRFAACPYQFLLATIYRLEPWDEPEPLVRMDPLTRGSLFHKAQAEFYRALRSGRARCR